MCGRYALYGPISHHREDDEQDYEEWLTGSISEVQTLMKPFPAEDMLSYFVSKKVNRASYDAPDLIDPIQDPDSFS